MSGFWKVCSFLCIQYLVGPPFVLITASMRRGMKAIIPWHCSGVMKSPGCFDSGLQVICMVTMVIETSFWYLWQCGQVPSPAGKLNQHLHKACQQKEAWSALKFSGRWMTVDFRKHSGPTPADDMAAQIITDCGNFTLDFKQHGFCASPLFLQTLDPDLQIKC